MVVRKVTATLDWTHTQADFRFFPKKCVKLSESVAILIFLSYLCNVENFVPKRELSK